MQGCVDAPPCGTRIEGESPLKSPSGAGTGNRTRDLIITSDVLYQLSYSSLKIMVPGGRIELPTRGFSVRCSTD